MRPVPTLSTPSMNKLAIQSPAKVNLYLEVLGRRENGYHELFTVFHRVSLRDRLTLKRIERPQLRLIIDHPELKHKKHNLIYTAYRLLSQIASWKGGVEVELVKRIPVAAGLGGGSSNGAHFLLGMNRLFGLGLPLNTLIRLGTRLGADVPFFLHEVNQSLGAGQGALVVPYQARRALWFVLIAPPFGLSTRRVYEKLNAPRLTRISRSVTITSDFFHRPKVGAISSRFITSKSFTASKAGGGESRRQGLPLLFPCRNDLFQASCALRPELRQIALVLVELGVKHWMMTGSGPTIICIYSLKEEAHRMARRIRNRKPELRIFVCHTY